MKEKKYSLIDMLKSNKVYGILCTRKQYEDLRHRVARIRALNEDCNGEYYQHAHLWVKKNKDPEFLILLFGAQRMDIERQCKIEAVIKYYEIDLIMKPRKKEKSNFPTL